MKETKKLIISLLITFLASFIGSYSTFPAIKSWYIFLNKPSFNPPNWIFGPVWTVLYLLMAISFFLLWQKNKIKRISIQAALFFLQLSLNILWSLIFFGMKLPMLAFVDIIFLWITILLMIVYFHKKSHLAAYLQLPYLFWVSFASVLNFWIVVLN